MYIYVYARRLHLESLRQKIRKKIHVNSSCESDLVLVEQARYTNILTSFKP